MLVRMKSIYKHADMSKLPKSGLTPSRKARSAPRPATMRKFERPLGRLDPEVTQCTFGHYPWDDWKKDALAAGVPRAAR